MKPSAFSLFRCSLFVFGIVAAASQSQAATFYWDNNGTSAGFGNAGGTWAEDSTSGGTSARWKTDPYGLVSGSATQATGNADIFHFGTNTLGLGAGTITVSNSNGVVNMGDTFFGAASGNVVLTGGTITFGAAKTITVNNTTNRIESVLAGAGTSLTKAGNGTLVLTGANTYTGTTIINGGTLNLGNAGATGSLASASLSLGGGTLNFSRSGTNTQSFASGTTITAGASTVLTNNGANTINLGALTRTAQGGVLNISATGTITTTTANTNGILGGWAVLENSGTVTNWAFSTGSGLDITGGVTYDATSSLLDVAADYANKNIDVNSSQAPDAAISANSLRFNAGSAQALTLQGANTLVSGGILVTNTAGNAPTITGGTLAGSTSGDLIVHQYNTTNGLTIDSQIVNNGGATALTKAGPGLLTLNGDNSFTGGVFIHGGQITLGHAGALNSAAPNNVTFGAGSTGRLTLNGNNLTVPVLSGASSAGTAVIENASADNVLLTINSSSNSGFAGVIQDGSGGGKVALTKAGSGTLTISGNNTYTGDTTISSGVVNVESATAFGASKVIITGASRINVAGGLTYANAIDVGAALQLQNPQVAASSPTSASAATYSGQLTGSGSITLVGGTGNGIFAEHAFTNTNNTFTGNVILPSGNIVGHDIFSFNSIGDGGVFTLQKTGNQNTIAYTGSTNIAFNTRAISLGTISGMMDGGGVVPVNRFANNGGGTVTFNTDMTVTGGGTSTAGTYLFFGGSNTGDNTFAGIIPNTTSGNNLGIGKSDAGKWILTRDNTFLGNVKISGGTLSVPKIDLAANAQPLGKGTIIEIGHQNTTGTLEFTGTGTGNSTTDKRIQMGNANSNAGNAGGAVIRNNGNGALTFSNSSFNPTVATVTATRTLTLTGTYNGTAFNEIQGVIQDNVASTGKVALMVSGSKWKLSGDNTYTGATSVTGGILLINGNSSTAIGAVSVTGGTLGGIGTVGGATSIGASGTLSPGQSPGTMTFLNTLGLAGSMLMEIDGTAGAGVTGGHDFVNLTGAGAAGVLTYGGTMTIDIGVIFGAGTYSWNLFDFASETGGFTSITLADQYSGTLTDSGGGVWGLVDGDNTWSFTESDGVLGLTVIPEPRAALLGALSLFALLRRRR